MRVFETIMTERQQRLNELSKQQGDAMHWWDFDMRPCFLFIDEYVKRSKKRGSLHIIYALKLLASSSVSNAPSSI